MTEATNPACVYKAISAVQKRLSEIGIAKARRNDQQNFMFRGIDDVYNVIAPILAEEHLCILPRVVAREFAERKTIKGGTLNITHVCMEFDFISHEDGSMHTVSAYGEGMDSGDKATPKAMSAAHKYAILQTFTIPTEGMPDADQQTYETIDQDAIADAVQAIKKADSVEKLNKVWNKAANYWSDAPNILHELDGYKTQRLNELSEN